MANVHARTTSRKAAKSSRRGEVRACKREQSGESWTRPLRRTRRAIDSSLRLIDTSRRVIDASERFAAGRTVRTTRQLEGVSGWLADAAARLQRAAHGLQKTTDRVALAPERTADAPERLVETTLLWLDAATRLAGVSDRLDETFANLLEFANGLVVPIITPAVDAPVVDFPAVAAPVVDSPAVDSLQVVAATASTPERRFLANWPARTSRSVLLTPTRRQRYAFATVADAARRISRGRAPPLVSTCSL